MHNSKSIPRKDGEINLCPSFLRILITYSESDAKPINIIFDILKSDELYDHTAYKNNHNSNFLSSHVFPKSFEELTSHIYIIQIEKERR